MKQQEENNFGTTYVNNVCRRLVTASISQILVENMDKMELVDPVWRNKLKQTGKNFKKELDKELDTLLSVTEADTQMLTLANIVEKEMRDVYAHLPCLLLIQVLNTMA